MLKRMAPDRPLYGIDCGRAGRLVHRRRRARPGSELNQALSAAGIYASGLEPGSDLESLFLELTTGGANVPQASPVRLIRAELLKARRRSATYVIFIVAIAITAAIYLLAGRALGGLTCQFTGDCLIEFPAAYAVANQLLFGLGGLLAVIYAAAFVGADWNWGVLRNVVARGESRVNYLLGKAAALAILIGVAEVVLFFFCILMTYVAGALYGIACRESAARQRPGRHGHRPAPGLPGPARAGGDRLCRRGRHAQPARGGGGRHRPVRR